MDTSIKENVYLLGLLWADGCVRKNKTGGFFASYESNLNDFNEIKPMLLKLGFGCFQERQRLRDGKLFGRRQGSFSTGKQDFCKWLFDNGFNEKSTIAPSKILSIIPKGFRYLFWRGYFDGDGCLYLGQKNELAFWSTINQDWSEIKNLFNELKLENHSVYAYERKDRKHCSSMIRTGIAEDVLKFCNYIYKNYDGIGFSRKYQKYKDFLPIAVRIKEFNKTTSKQTGVCFSKTKKKWKATISRNKSNMLAKDLHLGWFNTEKEAISVVVERKRLA